ncbi:uncharacterized protein DSM5745_09918 [Aspergillus mulundensis]|uniref:Uncharacterized protein n=1 Tax=Aspergillus mulundensis TaxID=1810919 RepID=A0A3D8QRV0_9EURO|nr:hypothetical protein DSM5745_09918 [Aspergillus mulundensis]RDW64507.1 hypothetical protein DSM5745_09918 [Aspergillus mulundensis]
MPRRPKRGRRPIPRTPIIKGIWKGALPEHRPDPNRGPAPDLANLGQYTSDQLITYMEKFPNHAVYIFEWATEPGNIGAQWLNLWPFQTPADVANWHLNTFGANTLNPQTPGATDTIVRNAAAHPRPLDTLVKRDALHALHALHAVNHWDPSGYAATGSSFLKTALQANLDITDPNRRGYLVYNYILYKTQTNRAFAQAFPIDQRLTDTPVVLNHLDVAIQDGPYDAFSKWWKALDEAPGAALPHLVLGGPAAVLDPTSHEALCKKTTVLDAEHMHQHNQLNLASLPNAWHHAVWNPNNKEFMDFIQREQPPLPMPGVGPARINQVSGNVGWGRPVEYAHENKKVGAFKTLVRLGANIDAWVEAELDNNWPQNDDKALEPDDFFAAGLRGYRNINPPNGTANGTLLHRVVTRLHNQVTDPIFTSLHPRDMASRRKRLTHDAVQMIYYIRRGNQHGQPNLATTDINGRTAWALARHHAILGLDDALTATATIVTAVDGSHTAANLLQAAAQGPAPAPSANIDDPTIVPGHRYPIRRTRRR